MAGIEKFEYETPEDPTDTKNVIRLAATDSFKADMQIVGKDGENNMHSHTGNDGFWYVMSGKARFYGDGDEVVAELEPNEGLLIPHDEKYWFESAGEHPLEILHIGSYVAGVEDRRIDHAERTRPRSS